MLSNSSNQVLSKLFCGNLFKFDCFNIRFELVVNKQNICSINNIWIEIDLLKMFPGSNMAKFKNKNLFNKIPLDLFASHQNEFETF